MAFLYGSRAEGLPREDSDVDIGVLFSAKVTSEDKIFALTTKLSLALSKKVNADANVIPVSWDFKKPLLYYNVVVKGTPVFVRDHAIYIKIRNEALFQMEDFELFGKDWQLVIARKNLEELGLAGTRREERRESKSSCLALPYFRFSVHLAPCTLYRYL